MQIHISGRINKKVEFQQKIICNRNYFFYKRIKIRGTILIMIIKIFIYSSIFFIYFLFVDLPYW